MVHIKLRCRPEDEKATIGVRMTTSKPTLSLSELKSTSTEPILEIQIHLRCLSSVQPSRPLTFYTSGTIFVTKKPEHGHMDNLALGMLGGGLHSTDNHGYTKSISLGYFRVHRARQHNDDATNLLDRPNSSVITVPSKESGGEVVVTHRLSPERLFAFAEKITPGDVEVGEEYGLRLQDGYVGASWWCWGGLEEELMGKKLHEFSEGFCCTGFGGRPGEEEVERGGWVTGEDVSQLVFRVEEGGETCGVVVVE